MKVLSVFRIKRELKAFVLLSILSLLLFALQSCNDDTQVDPTCETDPSLCVVEFDYKTLHSSVEVSNSRVQYYEDNSSDLEVQIFSSESNEDNFRPLILLSPGGGWTSYNRIQDMNAIAVNLARRGYVAGVVEYSINAGGSSWNPYVMVQSILDIKAAVKFFKKNAETYRISPDKIFTGGWSSGGQASLYSAHMSEEDFEETSEEVKALLEAPFDAYGFEPDVYEEYSSEVKGTLLLMPWSADPGLFDANGPAIMMIAHPLSHFSGGERIWGYFDLGGSPLYGPDQMREHALAAGYFEGANFHYHIMEEDVRHAEHINYSPLMTMHYDRIAEFFYQNLN